MLTYLKNKNFRKPGGLIGRYIIRFLKKNQPEYDELAPLFTLRQGDQVLEIGFGLGRGIYDFSRMYDCTFHGIDFSWLMVKKASRLNRESIKRGQVVLQHADFDVSTYEKNTFHCIYFLNVIYFWDALHPRLEKVYSLLKPHGSMIIFMADAVYFRNLRQPAGKTIFYVHSVDEVIRVMHEIGFTAIITTEHSKEKDCFYIVGHKAEG